MDAAPATRTIALADLREQTSTDKYRRRNIAIIDTLATDFRQAERAVIVTAPRHMREQGVTHWVIDWTQADPQNPAMGLRTDCDSLGWAKVVAYAAAVSDRPVVAG